MSSHISKPTHVIFDDGVYKVNSRKSGLDAQMLNKILDQVKAMLSYHNKVRVVRFDLHQRYYTPDNQKLSDFLTNEFKRIKREYNFARIGYAWVREQEKSKAQHYHIALMLDGNKIKNPRLLLEKVGKSWIYRTDSSFHIPESSNYLIKRDDEAGRGDMIYRLSYLAKGRGKGYQGKQANNYSTSRISPKPLK